MTRPRLSYPARVPIGLKVSEADAAQIDEVLMRPEFAGLTRSEWCLEIVRTALRYYARRASAPDPRQARASARPTAAQPASPGRPPAPRARPAAPPPAPRARPAAPDPDASSPASSPGVGQPVPAAPEPPAQPACAHPPAARDYQTGTCAACGAILWD